MRNLSKSKLIAFRQCPKRLWLEIHRPDLVVNSARAQADFDVGNLVGDIARRLYDPDGNGILFDAQRDGYDYVFTKSQELLDSNRPIFEAGFVAHGALAFADVMLPAKQGRKKVWRMVEVKSSTKVKDYHRDDAAIQSFIARNAGVELSSIALAHIDSSWIYLGKGDYRGLLNECDLTEEAFNRDEEVTGWIAAAQKIAAKKTEPKVVTGNQCKTPFECGFYTHCQMLESKAEYPVSLLPDIRASALKDYIARNPTLDLRDTPDELLSELQMRVKKHTLSGKTYFDKAGAEATLSAYKLPAYFLDFETIQFAVPIWKGTRPYQQIPFQFSLHRLNSKGKLDAQSFLDLSGQDPSRAFAESLVAVCGSRGPIFVYNAGFEGTRIEGLAECFRKLTPGLMAIKRRLVDLHPVTRYHYYHPSQRGSWSIKAVLPAVAPDLSYENLEGVQNGGMAMKAYSEAIHPDTSRARRDQIEEQLIAYCGLDTYAMVRLWQFLAGRGDLAI